MQSSEEILEQAARDGSIAITEWPRVLESVLQKLHDIVHNDFPLPSLPLPAPLPSSIDPEVVASTPPPAQPEAETQNLPEANEPPPNSQSSTKENDAPTNTSTPRPPVPSFSGTPTTAIQPSSMEAQTGTLPPDLLSSYSTSTRTLQRSFAHSPPYTVQRLAELVLYPRKHYRFLPKYLNALDRCVSVSSPFSDFPLPQLHAVAPNGGFLVNGDSGQSNGMTERDGLGSDESLGGALLTPIPWLKNSNILSAASSSNGTGTSTPASGDGELRSESTETIEGPNGAGSIETVSVTVNGVTSTTSNNASPPSPTLSEQSDASSSNASTKSTEQEMREQGAVTQGELLRQEQEAGVVPVAQSSPRRTLLSSGAVAVGREAPTDIPPSIELPERPEEHPHARGPDVIGMEDMGPQQHSLGGELDMEAAVGRGRSKSPQPPHSTTSPPLQGSAFPPMVEEEAKAGEPGKDPADVEKQVEKMKEDLDEMKDDEAAAEPDTVMADADGKTEEDSTSGDHSTPMAVDAAT